MGSQWYNRLCSRNKKVDLPRNRRARPLACFKVRGRTTELNVLNTGRVHQLRSTSRHNLPAPRSSFVGREREMLEIKQ